MFYIYRFAALEAILFYLLNQFTLIPIRPEMKWDICALFTSLLPSGEDKTSSNYENSVQLQVYNIRSISNQIAEPGSRRLCFLV